MKTTNILIDMEVHEESLSRLREIAGLSIETIEPRSTCLPLPAEILRDKHILFSNCPPENLSDMTSLELLQIASAGYEQLRDLGLVERKVRVCNAAGVHDIPIAELNIAMMVNLGRDLRGMIRNQESGVWDRDRRFQHEIWGSTVGIWGYGGIGRETARLAKNMGMVVHAMVARPIRRRDDVYVVPGSGDPEGVLPDRVFYPGQEQDFLSELDFLVLTMPLSKKTEGIVTEEYLRMLPSRAYLLNPARGPLIVEQALLKALSGGWIAGAALDTHFYYPMPADHPLWRFPNVIMTPHIAGSRSSTHFLERIWGIFAHNVERFTAGKPLMNELTPTQLLGDA